MLCTYIHTYIRGYVMCMHCSQVIDIASAQQSSVQHETTGAYAVPNETDDKKVCTVSMHVFTNTHTWLYIRNHTYVYYVCTTYLHMVYKFCEYFSKVVTYYVYMYLLTYSYIAT